MESNRERSNQRRRISRRSRFGCRNCKLRKVKCDEHKPQCKRCDGYGLMCNFQPHVPDLQPVADDAIRPPVAVSLVQLRPNVSNAIWTCDASYSFQLNTKCQDFITRYLGRSLITPHDHDMVEVNHQLLALAFTHPYLMHASLAVALAYDRYLKSSSTTHLNLEECYHWSQSISLFNRRLLDPVTDEDKDAIWGTAAALAVLAFACPDAPTAEQSWPMKPSDPSDLNWLRMGKGKMSLWCSVDPLRSNSLFHVMAGTYAQMNAPMPEQGIDGIPVELASVCHLDASSTAENSSYFNAAHALSMILSVPDRLISVGYTELFTRCIHGTFEDLLRKRDPIALLLLHLWYQKSGRSIWWADIRAKAESPSICLYLRTYYPGHRAIHSLLSGGLFQGVS